MCTPGPGGPDDLDESGIGWTMQVGGVPAHRENRKLLAWYEGLAAGGRLPERQEVDPADIRDLLHGVFLVVPAGDGEIRYRMVAAGIESRVGARLQGRTAGEVYSPDLAPGVRGIYNRVFETRQRVVLRGSFTSFDIGFLEFEALILPLRAPDGTVMAVGSMFAFDNI